MSTFFSFAFHYIRDIDTFNESKSMSTFPGVSSSQSFLVNTVYGTTDLGDYFLQECSRYLASWQDVFLIWD